MQDIHILAFGEIGLTPYEYYCMTPYEFQCMVKGWQKCRAYEAAIARKQIQLIYGMIGGDKDFTQFWPIEAIDENETKPRGLTRRGAIAIMKKVQARHDSQYKSQLN